MAADPVTPLAKPEPQAACTPHQILLGPPIDPKDRITIYSEDQFEAFIQEWAYFYLQEILDEYELVGRFGGAGDKGRDVVAYVQRTPPVVCDVFQCKHYANPLAPTDIWLELAKLCYNTFNKTIPIPRRYRFVAPLDVGPKLAGLFEEPENLRAGLIGAWKKTTGKDAICNSLVAGQTVSLDGDLLQHVNTIDLSLVGFKPIQEVINEHGKTIRHAPRFGGGLVKPCPPDRPPPPSPTPNESNYVRELLRAYQDHLRLAALDLASLSNHPLLHKHFGRSRERFYCAETLREFAKDSLPEGTTFEAVQDQVFDTVIDIIESPYPCGYTRLLDATKTAAGMSITNHPLGGYVKSKSLQGICHQLANDVRIKWVPHE